MVTCVRTSPDNKIVLSLSSDKSIVLLDSTTGEILRSKEDAHGATIYSGCWFPDGSKFATCSADKTVKIWCADDLALLSTFSVSEKPTKDDFQVGVVVNDQHVISLSLNGNLNFFEISAVGEPEVFKPCHVAYGHRKNVFAVDVQGTKIVSIDHEGRICKI